MARVVFLADGGRVIGSGHVMRCLALASVFAEGGWQVCFAAGDEARRTVTALERSGYEIASLPGRESGEAAALRQAWPDGTDILAVDHYRRGETLERACRGWAKRILVLDDLADRRHDADLLTDAGGAASAYADLVPPHCSMLAGPRFAIVHPRFYFLRAETLARRQNNEVRRILVSFGQIDAPNATAQALSAIGAAGFQGEVDVVLGSAAPHLAAIRALEGGRITLHVDSDEMPELMARADIAIGAGGGTAWERCALGLPTVLVEIAGNQRGIIAAILAAGAGLSAGTSGPGLEERIRGQLSVLLQEPETRVRISGRAAALVDGRGPLRIICAALVSPPARDGKSVNLRPAEFEDEAWLLDLQRQPQTRRFANDPNPPAGDGHRHWLARTIADPDRALLIVEHGGRAAGMLRLDGGPDGVRVNIAIDGNHQRKGIGAATLALAAQLVPGEALDAEILPGNDASRALFLAAGYRQVSARMYRREPL